MRTIWLLVGAMSLSLGMVGIFVPLLPTTPFILLAAYAFARSSERWHNWLLQHKVFGPMILDWREHGAISRRARILGLLSLVAIFGISLCLDVSDVVLIIQAVALTMVAAFILTRPFPPEA